MDDTIIIILDLLESILPAMMMMGNVYFVTKISFYYFYNSFSGNQSGSAYASTGDDNTKAINHFIKGRFFLSKQFLLSFR
jgi:hypothetical protein